MDEDQPYDPVSPQARVLGTQIIIAVTLGSSALLSFCALRFKFPKVYAARRTRRKDLPPLSNSFFGWMLSLYRISEEQVLEHAGLDAFVFLGFFKTTIKFLTTCFLFAITIINPIRLHYTGKFDQDEDELAMKVVQVVRRVARRALYDGDDDENHEPDEYKAYLWIYVVFTYLFTVLAAYFMIQQTIKVVRVRQKYLGGQNSITDRTIRLGGIPPELRTEEALKDHVESLGIGSVRAVHLCRNWRSVDELFDQRRKVITKLERAWCQYLGQTWDGDEMVSEDGSARLPVSQDSRISLPSLIDERERSGSINIGPNQRVFSRPTERTGFLGLFGPKVDVIDRYSHQLEIIDDKITELRREDDFNATGTAFVTLESVASAQMASQALLDPRPYKLIAETAPAPHDVIWRNLYLTTRQRLVRTYVVTLIISIMSVAMVVPIWYLAPFLQIKAIRKIWPALGRLLDNSPWLMTFVTGILPPLIFTLLNFATPYLYVYLSGRQGFISYGDVELSVISKNFFYIFVNLFLVFTFAGAASSYQTYLKDTTMIAFKLAQTLRQFSSFYVDLIILQGIGMFPFRLVQIGNVARFPLTVWSCQSPRDYQELYKPPIFNYGIHLPQPILIFIIIMLYSVISTKILAFGILYFVFGYFTYKYQLMYSMVHPQHSTGRAWPIIFRRVCLGLVLFHLGMGGILALQGAYFPATILAPLPIATFAYWYNFEKNFRPLLDYIALRAIETVGSDSQTPQYRDEEVEEDDTNLPLQRSVRRMQSRTLDEIRERHLDYVNPNLTKALDGPWIGVEGDEVILANSEGTRRKRIRYEEWE